MIILWKIMRIAVHIYCDLLLITAGVLGILWIAVKAAA